MKITKLEGEAIAEMFAKAQEMELDCFLIRHFRGGAEKEGYFELQSFKYEGQVRIFRCFHNDKSIYPLYEKFMGKPVEMDDL